jgi:hypothetical protein
MMYYGNRGLFDASLIQVYRLLGIQLAKLSPKMSPV